jgi:hypothetical protein
MIIYKSDNGKCYKWTHNSTAMLRADAEKGTDPTPEASQAEAAQYVSEGAVYYESLQDLLAALDYQDKRREAYPAIGEQLDQIYHEGIDAWKETIQAVKDANPKPE